MYILHDTADLLHIAWPINTPISSDSSIMSTVGTSQPTALLQHDLERVRLRMPIFVSYSSGYISKFTLIFVILQPSNSPDKPPPGYVYVPKGDVYITRHWYESPKSW